MIDVTDQCNRVLSSPTVLVPQTVFPTLRILPVEKLIPHERNNFARTNALKERLVADEVLRNPPIVAPLQGSQGNFVVLDGANRINAFKAMNVRDILAQIALPDEPGLDLKTWNQVVIGISPEELFSLVSDISDIRFIKDQNIWQQQDPVDQASIIQIHFPSSEVYSVCAESTDLIMRVHLLNTIMDTIGTKAKLDRTNLHSVEMVQELHPDLAGLIVFPLFKIEEILTLAASRMMVPAGITRFTISPRALRVNYDLSELSATNKSISDKNEMLMAWIQDRVAFKGVRSYDETTVMFDE